MPEPGTPDHVIQAARDLLESRGDPEAWAALNTAVHDYDLAQHNEQAWYGDWPYDYPAALPSQAVSR